MTTEQMRQYLLGQYPRSEPWKRKIRKMQDAQIIAVYLRIKNRKG